MNQARRAVFWLLLDLKNKNVKVLFSTFLECSFCDNDKYKSLLVSVGVLSCVKSVLKSFFRSFLVFIRYGVSKVAVRFVNKHLKNFLWLQLSAFNSFCTGLKITKCLLNSHGRFTVLGEKCVYCESNPWYHLTAPAKFVQLSRLLHLVNYKSYSSRESVTAFQEIGPSHGARGTRGIRVEKCSLVLKVQLYTDPKNQPSPALVLSVVYLHDHQRLILVKSGDIETNPGPTFQSQSQAVHDVATGGDEHDGQDGQVGQEGRNDPSLTDPASTGSNPRQKVKRSDLQVLSYNVRG